MPNGCRSCTNEREPIDNCGPSLCEVLHTVNAMLLETLSRSQVEVSCHLADLQVASDVAALVQLLFELVCPALSHTLFNTLGRVEGPAFLPICLPHLLTRVTTWQLCGLSSIAAEIATQVSGLDRQLARH